MLKVNLLKEEYGDMTNIETSLDQISEQLTERFSGKFRHLLRGTDSSTIGYTNDRFLRLPSPLVSEADPIIVFAYASEAETYAITIKSIEQAELAIDLLALSINKRVHDLNKKGILFRQKPTIRVLDDGRLSIRLRVHLLDYKYTREVLEDHRVTFD